MRRFSTAQFFSFFFTKNIERRKIKREEVGEKREIEREKGERRKTGKERCEGERRKTEGKREKEKNTGKGFKLMEEDVRSQLLR